MSELPAEPPPPEPPREVPPLEFRFDPPPGMRGKLVLAMIGLPLLCLFALWWAFTHTETPKDIVFGTLVVPLAFALLVSVAVIMPSMLWRILARPVLLRIDIQGLTLPKIGLIPWEDVGAWRWDNSMTISVAPKVGPPRASKTIRIVLLSPGRYRARLSWLSRLNWADPLTWGKAELGFNDLYLSQPAGMIAAGIEAQRAWIRVVGKAP